MKKIIKLIALMTAVALLAISLCSCQHLDELKANQAFYTDDTKETIIYHDSVYKAINPGNLYFTSNYIYGYFDNAYVTTEDVPALLSSWYGDPFTINHDEVIITANTDHRDYMDSLNTLDYVREDKYDEIKSIIEKGKGNLDHYYFTLWQSPEVDEFAVDYNVKPQSILLDDEATAVVNRTLNIDDDDKVKYDTLSAGGYSQAFFPRINCCDKNMWLTDYGAEYTIFCDNGKYYIWDGNVYNE